MLVKSKLNCSYWNSTQWSSEGCAFASLGKTHIICECNHLTAFGPKFMTPLVSKDSATASDLSTLKAKYEYKEKIVIDDLIRTPW